MSGCLRIGRMDGGRLPHGINAGARGSRRQHVSSA